MSFQKKGIDETNNFYDVYAVSSHARKFHGWLVSSGRVIFIFVILLVRKDQWTDVCLFGGNEKIEFPFFLKKNIIVLQNLNRKLTH